MTLLDLETGELGGDPEEFLTDADLAAPQGKPRPTPPKPKQRPPKRPRQPVLEPASQGQIAADLRSLDEQRERKIQASNPRLGPGSDSGYDIRVQQPARSDFKMEVRPSFDFRQNPFPIVSVEKPAELDARQARRRIGETQDEFLARSAQFEQTKLDLDRRRKESRRLGRAENLPDSTIAGRLAKSFATGAAEPFRQAARGIYAATGSKAPEWIEDPGMPLLNLREQEQFSTKLAQGAGSLIPTLLTGATTGGAGNVLLGSLRGLGSTYEEALSKGATPTDALAAGTVGALIGSLEGMLGAGSGHQAVGFLRNSLEEGGEEAFTQLLNNVNAKWASGYDPQRAISEGVLESGLIGSLLGGALPGGLKVADLAGRVRQDLGRPMSPAILDAAKAFMSDEGGSASTINAAEGLNNLLRYLKESKVVTPEGDPIPLYHGTSSPRVIEQIDFSKLDPDALYGPGFYMTQDSEVAAGDGGYATSKVDRETGQVESPSAYKLYADIRNPFDIDSGIAQDEFQKIVSLAVNNYGAMFLSDPDLTSGDDIYKTLVNALGGRKDWANETLKLAGYDGITHIGGGLVLADIDKRTFSTREEAETEAVRIGGEVTPSLMSQSGQDMRPRLIEGKVYDSYFNDITDSPDLMWEVRGHRVWIAFEPSQVKSATGNRGTFDPSDPRLSFKYGEGSMDPSSIQATYQPGEGSRAGVILAPAQYTQQLGIPQVGGISIDLATIKQQLRGSRSYLPEDLVSSIESAIADSESKGQQKVNIVFQGSGDSEGRILSNIEHETFHAGQAQGVAATTPFDPAFFVEDLYALHSPDLRYDLRITRLLDEPMGRQVVAGRLDEDLRRDTLVVELAAYVASGDGARFGLNPDQQAEFLVDYFEDIISHRGIEALEALAATAQLRPTTETLINQVRNDYAEKAKSAFAADRPVQGIRAALAAGDGGDGKYFSIPEAPGPLEGPDRGGNVQEAEPIDAEPVELLDLATGELGGPGQGGLNNPPPALPPAPFDPGFDPIITQTLLNDPAMAELTRAFTQAAHDMGLEYDPRIPPFIQIARAIADGRLDSPLIDAVYARYGLTTEQFARGFQASASAFGRGLQHLSEVQRRLAGQIHLNPDLVRHLPPEQIARALLNQLQASSLGRSLWQQGGTLLRKMALGRLATTATNVITTVGRLPLSIADGMSGFAWGMLHPNQFRNSTTEGTLAAARRSALNSMRSSAEVVRAMNPRQLAQLLHRQRPSEYAYYDSVVSQIEQYFPDLHRQLHGLSSQIDEAGTAADIVAAARSAVDRITNPETRAQYEPQVRQLERRLRFDRTVAGRLVRGVDWLYTLPTLPSQWQEFFFRRPFFVGALHSELAREGINFDQVVAEGTWADLDPVLIQGAVDRALEFTFAYSPHEDSQSAIERGAHHLIKGVNELGPIGFFIEAFPKALYNGLKFWYEYGPLGAIHPANQIRRSISEGGLDAVRYSDIDRLSRAALGTAMYVAAAALRSAAGGEEWWQIKTGRRDKAGKPIYLDIRRFQPFSAFVYLADLAGRADEGRLIDKQPSKDLQEIYLGVRRAGDQSSGALFDTLNATFAYWGEDFTAWDKASRTATRQVGQAAALPTVPLQNLRDLVAQFNADENMRRDTRDSWKGPAIDNIPWLRRGLPLQQPPTEPAGQPLNVVSPAAGQFMGLRTVSGGNFITREIARLGLNPFNWLHRDPDPTIDRAQFAEFARMLEARADRLAESPAYQKANDATKAALIEEMILDNDLPQQAREKGLQANPAEALRREKLKEAGEGMHRLRRRASGVDQRYRKP